jgi:hypothetical protein
MLQLQWQFFCCNEIFNVVFFFFSKITAIIASYKLEIERDEMKYLFEHKQ